MSLLLLTQEKHPQQSAVQEVLTLSFSRSFSSFSLHIHFLVPSGLSGPIYAILPYYQQKVNYFSTKDNILCFSIPLILSGTQILYVFNLRIPVKQCKKIKGSAPNTTVTDTKSLFNFFCVPIQRQEVSVLSSPAS